MCYLVAKDRNAHGCFALKTTHGKHLVELKRELNKEVGYKGVQLVTISRPTAYGEYAPYHFVDTERVRIEESGTKTDVTRLISARMATEFERGLYYGKNE